MKSYISYGLLIVLVLANGCGKGLIKDKVFEDIRIEYRGRLTTNPDFKPYIEAFYADFKKYTHDTNRGDIPINYGLTDAGKLGVCIIYYDGSMEISINYSYWINLSENSRTILIYHELGHCDLALDHDDTGYKNIPHSMMTTYLLNESLFIAMKDHYIKELFTGSKEGFEDLVDSLY